MSRSRAAVVICFDDGYASAAGVMLTSLFLNNPGLEFELYAIARCTQPDSLRSIRALCAVHRRSVRFVELDDERVVRFKVTHHFSPAAYFRLFAPSLVEADELLYLDVDLVVQADIRPLLDLGLGAGKLVAGALDNNPSRGFRERLGLSPDDPYVNTGVLRIAADRWRREGTTEALVDYYARHEKALDWADQDLINACLAGRIGVLEPRWNVLYGDVIRGRISLPGFDPATFDGIFHYNTGDKPWSGRSRRPYRALYERYAAGFPTRPGEALGPLRRLLRRVVRATRPGGSR